MGGGQKRKSRTNLAFPKSTMLIVFQHQQVILAVILSWSLRRSTNPRNGRGRRKWIGCSTVRALWTVARRRVSTGVHTCLRRRGQRQWRRRRRISGVVVVGGGVGGGVIVAVHDPLDLVVEIAVDDRPTGGPSGTRHQDGRQVDGRGGGDDGGQRRRRRRRGRRRRRRRQVHWPTHSAVRPDTLTAACE